MSRSFKIICYHLLIWIQLVYNSASIQRALVPGNSHFWINLLVLVLLLLFAHLLPRRLRRLRPLVYLHHFRLLLLQIYLLLRPLLTGVDGYNHMNK